MKIVATYANRTYDPDAVELVCAWDEYCVEGNYDGWLAEKKQALASWGDELLRHVDVEIDVPMADVYRALDPEIKVEASAVLVVDYGVDGDPS